MATFTDQLGANVRRRPNDQPGQNVIAVEPVGWLAVCIEFLGEPVKDLGLRFFKESGEELVLNAPVKTDDTGVYAGGRLKVGMYLCKIEGQKRLARITTVEDQAKPFSIVLPIGRPYFDIATDVAFDRFRQTA